MTQYGYEPLSPSDSGSTLLERINGVVPALVTNHKGPARPGYVQPGMMWIDDSGSEWLLKLYDGEEDITIAGIDAATHTLTTAGVPVTRKVRTGAGILLNGAAGTDATPAEAELTADLLLKLVFAGTAATIAGEREDLPVHPAGVKAAIAALASGGGAYLSGAQLAYVSTTTYSVAPGQAAAEGGASLGLTLSASLIKSLSVWAPGTGAGSLDTGAIAANTWYHMHLIATADGSTVDVLLSLSASAPSMPAGYTARRRLGSIKTNASSQVTQFVQIGDDFFWSAPVNDIAISPIPATATLYTLSVPSGVRVTAHLTGQQIVPTTNFIGVLLSSPDTADAAPGAATGAPTGPFNVGGNLYVNDSGSISGSMVSLRVRTDTSGRIRVRANATNGNRLYVYTYGWTDDRGKL